MWAFAIATVVLAAMLAGAPAYAQDAAPPASTRSVSGMAGLGNSFGGLGGILEYFVADSRLSVVAGLGSVPGAGVAGAGGLRVQTTGAQHRLYLEAAVAPLALSDAIGFTDAQTWYGPALSAGYSYAGRAGFSVLVGGGVGWAPAIETFEPVLNVGLGYTWRR
jgi:hypothetical protein